MKTYNFKVVLEPDEDFDGNPSGWHTALQSTESHMILTPYVFGDILDRGWDVRASIH